MTAAPRSSRAGASAASQTARFPSRGSTMAPSGFDYSKWDKLELSDDEDDHPGAKFIEENTLRRIKRESHERQEAERAERVEKLEKQIKKDKKRVKELLPAAGGPDAGADDAAEISRLNAAIAESESSLAKEASERKFNADEMCHVANERSLVGAACKPDVGDENLDYESYAKKYGPQLDAAAATNSATITATWLSFSRTTSTSSPNTPSGTSSSSASTRRWRATEPRCVSARASATPSSPSTISPKPAGSK